MLLASLNPSAVTAGRDLADAVRIGDVRLSRSGSAMRSGSRYWPRRRRRPCWRSSACLIARVPVVPVPADVGQAERRHILTDSGAQAWRNHQLPDDTVIWTCPGDVVLQPTASWPTGKARVNATPANPTATAISEDGSTQLIGARRLPVGQSCRY